MEPASLHDSNSQQRDFSQKMKASVAKREGM